jgi:S-adenosylmethionine synthetase
MRTAEFVSPKHADKMCDIISDTILDTLIAQDSNTKCLIETMGYDDSVFISGNVISNGIITNEEIKEIVNNISGINNTTINLTFQENTNQKIAYNQGISIGYASSETPTLMPFEYEIARELNKFIYQYYPFDGTIQITINGSHIKIVCSFQNSTSTHLSELIDIFLNDKVNKISSLNFRMVDKILNPIGETTLGGFKTNIGVSGKKSVMDSYGPRIPFCGKSFSGKDYYNTDRIGAYMARKIAVDTIKEFNLRYAIVELSYGSNSETPIQAAIKGNEHGINTETGLFIKAVTGYDLSPSSIINSLNLKNQNYSEISKWGHFGNGYTWDV